MRAALRIAVLVLAALALPAALGAPTVIGTLAALNAPRTDGASPPPAPVAHDPSKPTAVVVVGDRGAVVSDTLAPYEVLATTGEFNVYTVASEAHPVPLTGGLDLVPDLTFAGLEDFLDGPADVVVVPAMPDVGQPTTKPVTISTKALSTEGEPTCHEDRVGRNVGSAGSGVAHSPSTESTRMRPA